MIVKEKKSAFDEFEKKGKKRKKRRFLIAFARSSQRID
jgi:hypothetical protein